MELGESARKQGALWSIAALDWTEIQEQTSAELWRDALDSAGVGAGTRALDAGCGAGGASAMAQDRGAVVSACDASDALLAIARERLKNADVKLGELEHLPFPDASFDAVLAINSLQFTAEPAAAAVEFERVTVRGGRIAIVVWCIDECDQRNVFEAILGLFEKRPKRRGVFALSNRGEVEALFPDRKIEAHEIDCTFRYPNMETALRGQMAAGPSQRVAGIFGREAVEAAIRGVLETFAESSGEITMQNRFRNVIVTR